MNHSSPSSTARVSSRVGSEPATPGSVTEKADGIVPAGMGSSQRSRCSGVAPRAINSALPESGALYPPARIQSAPEHLVQQGGGHMIHPLPANLRVSWAAHRPRADHLLHRRNDSQELTVIKVGVSSGSTFLPPIDRPMQRLRQTLDQY